MADDPYIGKIVRVLINTFCIFDRFEKSHWSSKGDYCSYEIGSLFYVLAMKEKEYNDEKHDWYIVKPLNKDLDDFNPNKEPVWFYGFYMGNKYNNDYFEIVE